MKPGYYIVIFMQLFCIAFAQTTDVSIPGYGTVQGLFSGTGIPAEQYSAFYGIPYAEIPTGTHRFMRAEPKVGLPSILDATTIKEGCVRTRNGATIGQEDCLHLNIRRHGV